MQELVIGIGSNLGDRRKNILDAITLVGERIGRVTAVSSLVETEPIGFESANRFLNGAFIVEDEPAEGVSISERLQTIIRLLQSVEAGFGRVRTGVYTDRAIDLDILFYGNEVVNIPGIVVPHPRLHEREFVLVPLKEICPDKIHPVIELAIRDLLNEVMK
jgi:2-amino-4-hydroxy-6-hydroxymethyldihydropteridine diphosphokinase